MDQSWQNYFEAFNAMGKYKTQVNLYKPNIGSVNKNRHQLIDSKAFKLPIDFDILQRNKNLFEIVINENNKCNLNLLIDVKDRKNLNLAKTYLDKLKSIIDKNEPVLLKTFYSNSGNGKNSKRVKLALAETTLKSKKDQYKWFEAVLNEACSILKNEIKEN
ncbi:MAG: hypothetical protein ACPGVH_02690 [Chitinophagales bacterium]